MCALYGNCTCGRRDFLGIRHDMTKIRHVATGMRRDPLRYTKRAPMMQCAMGALWAVMHVNCTYFFYSHSIVKKSLQFVPVFRSLF